MKVKVRAVIPHRDEIVLSRERRRGREHLTLPGGRPQRGESLTDALVREVHEETKITVVVEQLLYVAEVVAGKTLQELNLIFLAETDRVPDGCVVAGHEDIGVLDVMPPLLGVILKDRALGWSANPRFLGNVHAPRARLPT